METLRLSSPILARNFSVSISAFRTASSSFVHLQLQFFQRAEIGNDMHIEKRGHKALGIELAKGGLSFFALAKLPEIIHLALVDSYDKVFADNKIYRDLLERGLFFRNDRIDAKLEKSLESIDLRPPFALDYRAARNVFKLEGGRNGIEHLLVSRAQIDPQQFSLAELFDVDVFDLYFFVVADGVIEISVQLHFLPLNELHFSKIITEIAGGKLSIFVQG